MRKLQSIDKFETKTKVRCIQSEKGEINFLQALCLLICISKRCLSIFNINIYGRSYDLLADLESVAQSFDINLLML